MSLKRPRQKPRRKQRIDTLTEERRKRIAEMYCRWVPYEEMAKSEGITPAAISQHMKVIRERWIEEQKASYDERIVASAKRFQALADEARKAWDRSQKDAEEENAERYSERVPVTLENGAVVQTAGKESTRVSKRKKGQYGDAAFLAEARACEEKVAKLYGLLSDKVEHSGSVETVKVFLGKDPRELI